MTEAADPMDRLNRAADAVRARCELAPRAVVVLGTGLGGLADAVEDAVSIPFDEIPGFPRPTVPTHHGRLVLGRLEGTPVAVLHGRLHRYEGHSLEDVVFPVRVARLLGAEVLVETAACGGMHPLWETGDIVLLDDHLNLTGESPLTGPNLDELGPRFPDMSEPYDRELQGWALDAALARGIPLRRGVYAGVTGPNLETRAEYRMLRFVGADVVGMSTVPEVIAARHAGMRVVALCVVTDECLPDALEPADVESIIRAAEGAGPALADLIRDVVGRIDA